MVVKLERCLNRRRTVFESRVILDGSQTQRRCAAVVRRFESRVILDGSQTHWRFNAACSAFESRVILDGSQTVR